MINPILYQISLELLPLFVLNFGFNIVNGIRRFHLKCDGLPRKSFDEDLHGDNGEKRWSCTVATFQVPIFATSGVSHVTCHTFRAAGQHHHD